MNAPVLPKDVKGSPETVTTGPVTGSRKAYASPAGRPDIRVPYREIVLSDPKEEPVRVYDPSGPYTETDARIDLNAGLPGVREPWIAARGYASVATLLLDRGADPSAKDPVCLSLFILIRI